MDRLLLFILKRRLIGYIRNEKWYRDKADDTNYYTAIGIPQLKQQIEELEQKIKTNKLNRWHKKNPGELIEFPPDGMIYHFETISETGETWIGNKPCQYATPKGYYCGWGLAPICFPFSELGKSVFLTREEAKEVLQKKYHNE